MKRVLWLLSTLGVAGAAWANSGTATSSSPSDVRLQSPAPIGVTPTAVRKKVVDSTGKFVGTVLSDSPTEALIHVRFRGALWKLVVSADGPSASPSYTARFFESTDCSGTAYSPATRFDGSGLYTIWGGGYFPLNGRTGEFEYPRAGAAPRSVTILSATVSSGSCISQDGTDTRLFYVESDIEVVDPLAGTTAPYRISQ